MVRLSSVALLVFAAGAAACSPSVDIGRALQVTDVATGWFDEGVVGGQNKLVPSVTFRLRNAGSAPLRSVQLNLVFVLLPEKEEWDAMLTPGIGRDGLQPGAATKPITVRAKVGFTGEQPRAEMLQHRSFQDVNVRTFAKYGSNQWVRLGEYRVERRLLTK